MELNLEVQNNNGVKKTLIHELPKVLGDNDRLECRDGNWYLVSYPCNPDLYNEVKEAQTEAKMFNPQFAKTKFNELKHVQNRISYLSAILQNPMPVTFKDIMELEDEKNLIINRINMIVTDITREYEKCPKVIIK